MGACFTVPLMTAAEGEGLVAWLQQQGFVCAATALREDAKLLTQLPKAQRMALLIGNEGHGLANSVIDVCDAAVIIHITDRVESLNAAAAAAIAMWELRP